MRAVRPIDFAALARTARAGAVRFVGSAGAAWRNPALRDKAWASATFAAIFGLTLLGVDYVITGGPTWNPGGVAYAYEPEPRAVSRLPPTPVALADEPPPPAPLYAEDYEIFEYGFVGADALLGGPSSGGLQNAAYTIAPPINANTRPSYASSDPYAGRVLRDEDIVLTDEVSSPKQAF
jgi:hypothetical protein